MIPVIMGPTCSGKTSLALRLCKELNAEILSADSRQAIKFMDIGTGKMPLLDSEALNVLKFSDHWEINGITIWGYDLALPSENFSAFDFATYSLKKIREIKKRGKNIIIVGGTGFYIDLLTGRVVPDLSAPDLSKRAELNSLSLETLQNTLISKDPEMYSSIDVKNKVRLVRALERIGSKDSADTFAPGLPYLSDKFLYVGLKSANSYLYSRADLWTETLIKQGLVQEVESLISLGYKDSPKLQGLVYKSILNYIDTRAENSQTIIEPFVQRVKFDLHSYIRRQLTYFKKNPDTCWFDIESTGLVLEVLAFINAKKVS